MDAIVTENLTKRYKLGWAKGSVLALEALHLRVQCGEIYGLLGPNGSGKTTTLKLLLGLVAPTAGNAWIFDTPCNRVEARRAVGYLPENPNFYRYLSGAETLEFFGKLCGLRGPRLHERIDELLIWVGLDDVRNRPLAAYSKGMLQRIGLAQALIHDPDVVLLDEPTAGVDPIGARDIRELILRLKNAGKTVLLSSHLLAQVQDVCDRIGILNLGTLILEGAVAELVRDQKKTSITVQNLSDDARKKIEAAVAAAGARVLSVEHPQTTLEELFIEAVLNDGRSTHHRR
jgi:ABC-2 type transport system ATP-binding protein